MILIMFIIIIIIIFRFQFQFHFVVNPFKVVTTPLSERQLVKKPMQLLVAHPRSVRNAYQFLEGTSMLAHIAMHPEIFPSVYHN